MTITVTDSVTITVTDSVTIAMSVAKTMSEIMTVPVSESMAYAMSISINSTLSNIGFLLHRSLNFTHALSRTALDFILLSSSDGGESQNGNKNLK